MMASRRSPKFLFVVWVLTIALLLSGLGLTVWNLPLLRERAQLRSLMEAKRGVMTLGQLLDDAGTSAAERAQIRAAYEDEDIDLYGISWDLRSRPTPFVGAAPDPGSQSDGPINRQQLRDEREVAMPKPAGTYRIFLTGGSFAYSVGCDIGHSIARYLEEELNRAAGGATTRTFEVWNAAVPSWASSHERTWITHRLAALDPDMIVMLTGTNDCHWAFGGIDVMDVRTYSDDEYFAMVNAARRIAGVEPYTQRPPWGEPAPVPAETVAARFAANVRLAALALEPAGVPVLVALQPTLGPETKILTEVERHWIEAPKDAARVAYLETCFQLFEAEVGALEIRNLSIVSLRGVFAERSDALFLDIYHVGDKGNLLLADRLADEVLRLARPAP